MFCERENERKEEEKHRFLKTEKKKKLRNLLHTRTALRWRLKLRSLSLFS